MVDVEQADDVQVAQEKRHRYSRQSLYVPKTDVKQLQVEMAKFLRKNTSQENHIELSDEEEKELPKLATKQRSMIFRLVRVLKNKQGNLIKQIVRMPHIIRGSNGKFMYNSQAEHHTEQTRRRHELKYKHCKCCNKRVKKHKCPHTLCTSQCIKLKIEQKRHQKLAENKERRLNQQQSALYLPEDNKENTQTGSNLSPEVREHSDINVDIEFSLSHSAHESIL